MGSDTETEKKRTPAALAPIAKPLAGKKLCKRTLKLVRRASEAKCLKRGVKEVVKIIRRGNKGPPKGALRLGKDVRFGTELFNQRRTMEGKIPAGAL